MRFDDGDMKKIFEVNDEIPENVNVRIRDTYSRLGKKDLCKKDVKGKGCRFKYSLMIAGLLCMLVFLFDEELVSAAKRGYRFIYGKGEVLEDKTAYVLNEELVIGEGINEFRIYGIYWYENEIDIFGKKKAENYNFAIPILVNTKSTGSIGKYIGETDVHFKIRTDKEANNEIVFKYEGAEYNISLKSQLANDDMKVIEKETEFGKIVIYPIKTDNTVYFYDFELKEKYEDYGMVEKINGEIKLYNKGKELSKEDYVINDRYIALKGEKIDKIEFGSSLLIYSYSDFDKIQIITLNTPKMGESVETDEVLSNKFMTVSDISIKRTEEGLHASFKCDNDNVSMLALEPINICQKQNSSSGHSNSVNEWIFTGIPEDMPETLEYGIGGFDIISDENVVVELD